MISKLLAIAIGASCGAWIRWGLSLLLNPLTPFIPLGTVTVNLAGSYLIGVCLPLFIPLSPTSEIQRLLITTGFLGSLTTFSTFSAEVISRLNGGEHLQACFCIFLHLLGSLSMTLLGVYTARTILTV